MDKVKTFICFIFFCGLLFQVGDAVCSAAAGEEHLSTVAAVPPAEKLQGGPSEVKQDDFGVVLDRLSNTYLEQLKNLNKDLKNEYDALVANYGAYRANYMRSKFDMEHRRETSNFVLKNLQDLEVVKAKREARIKELEKKKEDLRQEALSSHGNVLPEGLSREWEKEEAGYKTYIDAIYRKLGWWLGMEFSPLWRNDERFYWNNIQNYYRQHPGAAD